ncbi:uncharacterized protein LOC111641874 [Centruroides sculpturatus]|uniref:uncharacterized protein LOC111641874 n=1 Tax=Centruroides sculpturatus TaxID=218467 RepID=UPI000C6DB892|nr:uncharacterized protein LOC111641874 [Centruroides sculpturatus]
MERLLLCLLVSWIIRRSTATLNTLDAAKVEDVSVVCRSGDIRVSIATDRDFNGMVYPRGLAENSSCLTEYSHAGPRVEYRLPLHSCNTMSSDSGDGVEYFNTIVVQPHPKLVTGLGKGFHVRCKYENRKETLGWQREVGTPDPISLAGSGALPVCGMKIFRGQSEEKVADRAKIGDRLTLVVSLPPQDEYGMKVTNCVVRDGLERAEQPLVNNEGCPVDEELMGAFHYDGNLTRASVTFPAHKFPYTPSVYYQCNVKLCHKKTGGCRQLPPNCDEDQVFGRSRRSADRIEETGSLRELIREQEDPKYLNVEVYSGLYVDEDTDSQKEAEEEEEKARPLTDEDDFCVSTRKFAIGIAIAGVLLVLAVLLLVACILHRRRRRKGTSTAGSSIYSGPYSNRAFGRD